VRRDPGVAMVVADDVVTIQGQAIPRGVQRVFGLHSSVAAIDGVDDRVDADVAIVDTGIDRNHPDLNVVGGINCSTSDPTAWYDSNGHGTHVAGTVGALDNGIGVVGVAPGVRLWGVRILDSAGNGLLSWYVCGLDWITAQRDPLDETRPLFEAVNMSVAKPGSDDRACGAINKDILHAAICRLTASGVTVVAAAGNNSFNAAKMVPASYDEVITVSALADTDGLPGGLGGRACYSWGSYDKDDTFADFSNYGADVDLIAPGKCTLSTLPNNSYGYLSGTSMAAPLVTGAVALYKSSRPLATPTAVKTALQAMGNLDWNVATDPDAYHERLLDVSRIVPAGDYAVDGMVPPGSTVGAGMTIEIPVSVNRAEDFPDRVDLSLSGPPGLSGSFDPASLTGLASTASLLTLAVAPGTAPGRYSLTLDGRSGSRDRTMTLGVTVDVLPVTRLAGPNRFATAADISAATFKTGAPVVYVANGLNFPDALAGAAAAAHDGGPMLLVRRDSVPTEVKAELTRLKPGRIVVLGGGSMVSAATTSALRAAALE
jgi:subtilisin